MAKFNKNTNNFKKDDKKATTFQKKKPTYVKKQLPIAYTDFYADVLDSLYNLLSEISWDKISIPVKMSRAEFTGDKTNKGSIVIGNVVKFNNDNTFTVSMTEDNAKLITDKSVMNIRCYKDRASGEITFITELSITERFESIDEHFKDIEEAFTEAEDTDTPAEENVPDDEVAE